jgi:hypothetical protein
MNLIPRSVACIAASAFLLAACANEPCSGVELLVSAERTDSRVERIAALSTLVWVARPRATMLALDAGGRASGTVCLQPGRNRIMVRSYGHDGQVLQHGEVTVDAVRGREEAIELVKSGGRADEFDRVRILPAEPGSWALREDGPRRGGEQARGTGLTAAAAR